MDLLTRLCGAQQPRFLFSTAMMLSKVAYVFTADPRDCQDTYHRDMPQTQHINIISISYTADNGTNALTLVDLLQLPGLTTHLRLSKGS